ncbi:hypothetical protein BKA83DRAFT_4122682 [Pisolithus microcarpus]|nr:hypothetical protein BKA83DRAFT_4122682 [Pisolithus microcarpus]
MGGHGRGRDEPGGFRANASGDSWQVLVVILPGKGNERRDRRRGGHYNEKWRNGRLLAEMTQKIVEGEDCHQICFWVHAHIAKHLCAVGRWTMECQVGREVWIISGPSKGYRGTLRSVGRTTCQVAIHSGIMQLKHTAVVTESGVLLSGAPLDPARMAAFIELRRTSFIRTAPPPRRITPPPPLPVADPSAEPGPSTSAYNPWVVHPDDATSRCSKETVQQQVDYGCVPWLFDNNFCDYAKWHVCLRVSLSYNHGSLEKRVVRTTAPDRFSTVAQGCGLAPPGHVSVTVTSSTVSANVEHHFIPACDLTPANPTSAGQSCLILRGKLAGQIHRVKKCQSKKAPKGVELEDGTKLPFGDVCQVIPVNP